jgi:cytochrome P450
MALPSEIITSSQEYVNAQPSDPSSNQSLQTILSVSPWVIHYSKELFGEDADEFNPNRWLEPRGQAMEKYYIPVSVCVGNDVKDRLIDFQFGAGYNSCQGRNIANLEVFKTTATLVRDFDIKQVDPNQKWKYVAHFTAVPHGWPCYVTCRT